jgi:integrase
MVKRMANLKVTLVRNCKTEKGWGRHKVAFSRNGKIRPDYILVKAGTEYEQKGPYPEGHYELRWYEGASTVYRSVGHNPVEALRARDQEVKLRSLKEELRVLEDTGGPAPFRIVEGNGRIHLRTKGQEFVERQRMRKKFRAATTARQALKEFFACIKVTYADELTEKMILSWHNKLQDEEQENEDRTVYNKHVSLFAMLKWAGVDTKPLAPNGPPDYSERAVIIYDGVELTKLFACCDPYQRLVLLILLKTGLRMEEAMKLRWPEVNFVHRQIHVASSLRLKKRIKDTNERVVPCPSDVILLLKQWREKHPNTKYVLGTRNDSPNKKMLQMLKRLARKAGLNCGDCEGCETKAQECRHWTIKRFRATYITMLLRDGYDVRTVMDYSGHEDMETMMKYLAVAQRLRGRIDTVNFLDAAYAEPAPTKLSPVRFQTIDAHDTLPE